MTEKKQKGMFRRTFGLLRGISIPWHLYILQVILGMIVTRVSLLYVPHQTSIQMGVFGDGSVIGSYLGLLLLSVVISVINAIPTFYASSIVTRRLQNRLINHSLRLNMRSLESNASQLVSWITGDCADANGLITCIVGFVTGIYATYASFTSMQAIDMSMAGLVPIILVYVIFNTWVVGKLVFLRERRERRANAELTAYLAEHLSFFTQIKQLHSQEEEIRRGKEAINQFYKADVYVASLTLINGLVGGSLNSIITILVFVMGVPLVNSGSITLAELAAFKTYMTMAYGSLRSLPQLYTDLMYYNGKLFYISNLMAEPEEIYGRERSMDLQDQDLSFENVDFSYNEQTTLENVTFTIPKGKFTVVVGPNGSGKTTLFKLIERFYEPENGSVRFGPYAAEEFHLQEWRQSMAYVLQDPQLFDGTIRDNITYGMNRDATDDEVAQAAKLACVEEFVDELPGGYDFVIGPNGSRLSAGQRQRLAIARAVMLDPAYLLLDEATSNLDIYAKQEVSEALFRLMKGRTTIMITHDMAMLDRADNVIVLNNGVVEAAGPRDQVKATCPTLRALVCAEATVQKGTG